MIYTGRGSTGLWALLAALDTPGGRIIVPANVCEIVVAVILKAGWSPVFCDVDPSSGNSRVEDLDAAWRPDTAAVLAVSNFGTPLDMSAVVRWARAKGVYLIEDVCNALGAQWDGRDLGLWGDAAIFSFGYSKIIEHRTGGGLTIASPAIRSRACQLIETMPVYNAAHAGANAANQSRLQQMRQDPSTQNAATYRPFYSDYASSLWYRLPNEDMLAIDQAITVLPDNLVRRRSIAALYDEGIHHPDAVRRPNVAGDVYWRYTFTFAAERRPALIDQLRMAGVLVSTWYPPVAHLFLDEATSDTFPGAALFGDRVINLFTDYRATPAAAATAVSVINAFV